MSHASGEETGLLDNVSATISCLPGTWVAFGLYLIIFISRRWQRTGTALRSLPLIRGTRGLWSVCRLNCCNPLRYLSNFSQAHTDTGHSFSICAYLVSAGFNVLDAKATGFLALCCCPLAREPHLRRNCCHQLRPWLACLDYRRLM